jgi:two-component system KDP operon response regulator KdpE
MEVLLIGDSEKTADEISMSLHIRYPEAAIVRLSPGLQFPDDLRQYRPDLMILHSVSSGKIAVELIKAVRQYSRIPLLVLGENESGEERAFGLEAGADEYITRPYSLIEFLARCGVVMRRASSHPESRIANFNGLKVHIDTREVFLSGKRIKLTPIEYELLAKLAQDEGHLVNQDDLLEHVWGAEYRGDSNLLKTYIYRLRKKLEDGSENRFIINERGFGYRLNFVNLAPEMESPVM